MPTAAWRPDLLARLAHRFGVTPASMAAPEDVAFNGGGGLPMNAIDWGGDGIPVIFLHGGSLTARTWDLVCVAMREDFRCFALDMRGHGESGWSNDYSIPAAVADVIALADTFAWPKMHLVGMSLGGTVAGHTAAAYPARVASLAMIDVGPGVDFNASIGMRVFFAEHDRHDSVQAFIDAALAFSPRSERDVVTYRMNNLLKQDADGTWTWKNDRREPHDYDHILAMLEQLTMLARQIACPTLIVRGQRSTIFSAARAKAFAERFPRGSAVEIPDAGHNVQEDNPAALATALRKHFADVNIDP